jgi:asparagine synthase (glutamine-hydrolysing)
MMVPGDPSVACSTTAAVEWDKAWAGNLDPSGRAAVGCHDASYIAGADADGHGASPESVPAAGAAFPASSKPIAASIPKSQVVY